MTDVGEEGGLGPVEFSQLLSPLPLLFVGMGVGNGRGDVTGQEVEKPSIPVVEDEARTDADHDEAGGLNLSRLCHR